MGYAEEAVKRFYKGITRGVEELLKEGMITEGWTVKELMDFCQENEKE